jgi:NAD(P)H-hydrate epimerase
MPGAAILTCLAAYRAGAGLVTLASTPETCRIAVGRIPEIKLAAMPSEPAAATRRLIEIQGHCNASVFGPGLGRSAATMDLLKQVWPEWRIPAVIDADALMAPLHGIDFPTSPTVLTPHAGELARMLSGTSDEIESDRFGSIRQAVDIFGGIVLLKGAWTLIGGSDRTFVCPYGHPAMATGGMGDVLSGVIGTLLAQTPVSIEAAYLGACWHGIAGELAAEDIGIGLMAHEVAECLPLARTAMEQEYLAEPNEDERT